MKPSLAGRVSEIVRSPRLEMNDMSPQTRFALGPKLRWLWHALSCHRGQAFMQYHKIQRPWGWWHLTHRYVWLRCGTCHQVFLGHPDELAEVDEAVPGRPRKRNRPKPPADAPRKE
jgi:hypothetical protein